MSELSNDIYLNNTNSHFENEKNQLALKISKVGIWDYNAEHNIISFSKPSKAIIGLENDNSFGANQNDWNNRVHPDDREKYYKDFNDHLKGIIPTYENRHRVKHKDGSYRWVLDRGQVVEKNDLGKVIRVIGTHVDITEYAENELKVKHNLNIITEQNNKLQNFAHIVTHNLKQHAGNFESLLDFYKDATNDNEKQEIINYLSTVSSSLTKTITSLKDLVSVQSNKNPKAIKLFLSKEIDAVLKNLDFVITENKAVISNNVDSKFYIYFNPSYFESIIQNILSNAIKYKHPDRYPIIDIDLNYVNNNLILTIKDNGIGIDLEKHGKSIFGLYKTFHTNAESEGVGLYLVKNQVEAYGGFIDVKSKLGEGSMFIITIPNK